MVTCPTCKHEMVVKTNNATGKEFYACSQYPNCKTTLPMTMPSRTHAASVVNETQMFIIRQNALAHADAMIGKQSSASKSQRDKHEEEYFAFADRCVNWITTGKHG